MKQYLNFSHNRSNYSLQHGFNLIFKKVETLLFAFLCIVFLLVSKVNEDFSRDVSSFFVGISLPVVKTAAFPFNTVIGLLTDFSELVDAKKENKIIKEELASLKAHYVDVLNINEENRKLRETLNFVSAKSSSFEVARIVGYTNQMFNQKIYIDIGKNAGVKEGQIVTANRAVIGRIEEVEDKRSRLILLNDATSRIPVITSKARIRGILAGNGSNSMEILYLPKNHKIEVGDSVFTSGDGDTLPSGLFIGVVKKVTSDSAFVVMTQDIAHADIVTIMEIEEGYKPVAEEELIIPGAEEEQKEVSSN